MVALLLLPGAGPGIVDTEAGGEFGDVFPAEPPGGVSIGALIAPSGAGVEVWAIAMPANSVKAAEAIKILRMKLSLP